MKWKVASYHPFQSSYRFMFPPCRRNTFFFRNVLLGVLCGALTNCRQALARSLIGRLPKSSDRDFANRAERWKIMNRLVSPLLPKNFDGALWENSSFTAKQRAQLRAFKNAVRKVYTVNSVTEPLSLGEVLCAMNIQQRIPTILAILSCDNGEVSFRTLI
jgi:hypothetical protein